MAARRSSTAGREPASLRLKHSSSGCTQLTRTSSHDGCTASCTRIAPCGAAAAVGGATATAPRVLATRTSRRGGAHTRPAKLALPSAVTASQRRLDAAAAASCCSSRDRSDAKKGAGTPPPRMKFLFDVDKTRAESRDATRRPAPPLVAGRCSAAAKDTMGWERVLGDDAACRTGHRHPVSLRH
jgi:hypothetical protein